MSETALHDYLSAIEKDYQSGQATEHTYRGALKALLEALDANVFARNEPKRIKCGAPDYMIERNNLTIGYIEAKDIDISLDKVEKDEQLKHLGINTIQSLPRQRINMERTYAHLYLANLACRLTGARDVVSLLLHVQENPRNSANCRVTSLRPAYPSAVIYPIPVRFRKSKTVVHEKVCPKPPGIR